MHKPVVGRITLAGLRLGMRVANHLPPVKRRMVENLERERGAERVDGAEVGG